MVKPAELQQNVEYETTEEIPVCVHGSTKYVTIPKGTKMQYKNPGIPPRDQFEFVLEEPIEGYDIITVHRTDLNKIEPT